MIIIVFIIIASFVQKLATTIHDGTILDPGNDFRWGYIFFIFVTATTADADIIHWYYRAWPIVVDIIIMDTAAIGYAINAIIVVYAVIIVPIDAINLILIIVNVIF